MQAGDRSLYQGDEEEEEQPPTEYDEDGTLTTSLQSFADLRIIRDMASSMPGSGTGAFCAASKPHSTRDLLLLPEILMATKVASNGKYIIAEVYFGGPSGV